MVVAYNSVSIALNFSPVGPIKFLVSWLASYFKEEINSKSKLVTGSASIFARILPSFEIVEQGES